MQNLAPQKGAIIWNLVGAKLVYFVRGVDVINIPTPPSPPELSLYYT